MFVKYGETVLGGFLLIPLAGSLVRYTGCLWRGPGGQLIPVLYDRLDLFEYPQGYPVPLCSVMIVLLVLDDLVTLPSLPPLECRQAGQRGKGSSMRNFSWENAIMRH